MPELDMYKSSLGPVLRVAAVNIPEFYALLDKANEQAAALRETMNKLNNFYFDFEVSVNRGAQTGGMEAASSITNVMPTK